MIDIIADPEKQKEEIENELMVALKKYDDQIAEAEEKEEIPIKMPSE